MKELSMYIRPEKLEAVKHLLIDEFGCGGMTVLNSMGCGGQKGFQDEIVGIRTSVNLLPKLKVEVIVKDDDTQAIVQRLCETIATGKFGDGKIVIKNVEDVIRVRTGERGNIAI